MKKLLFVIITGLLITSCKMTTYTGDYGQVNKTQVVLSSSNFKVLGSFTGTAYAKRTGASIKNDIGLVALAKADLLANAKKEGVELTGSRTMINVVVDFIENTKHVSATVTAEIIEFKR